ncbi:hypothetical protein D9619_005800 [Psilocybe cf. subviscida]|uniref:FUN14 family-domain-containing protein n=1 Tax=Psilocybe cf. subviscida TaxID=2480587 RepID=A0A8H5FBJ8_9AGAR|nr:hypothetical protein D9619_005800 [Psilocybe cf. subviscida]
MLSAFSSALRPSLRLNKIFPHTTTSAFTKAPARLQHTAHSFSSSVLQATRTNGSAGAKRLTYLVTGASIAGLGLGLTGLQRPVYCDVSSPPQAHPMPITPRVEEKESPLPKSSVSMYELGFGTVAGICAGVFVKKGAKAVAWFMGGIFVLLQYMGSASLVRVDWKRIGARFEDAFHSKDASGQSKPPTVLSLWNWTINFLTADFQPRASFVAGFVLGLRIG